MQPLGNCASHEGRCVFDANLDRRAHRWSLQEATAPGARSNQKKCKIALTRASDYPDKAIQATKKSYRDYYVEHSNPTFRFGLQSQHRAGDTDLAATNVHRNDDGCLKLLLVRGGAAIWVAACWLNFDHDSLIEQSLFLGCRCLECLCPLQAMFARYGRILQAAALNSLE